MKMKMKVMKKIKVKSFKKLNNYLLNFILLNKKI